MSRLIIITELYPYGNGETSFLYREIESVQGISDEVVLVSNVSEQYAQDNPISVDIPTDVKHINISPQKMSGFIKIEYLFKALFSCIFWREITYCIRNRGFAVLLHNIRNIVSQYVVAERYFARIKRELSLDKNENTTVYTYWYSYYTMAFLLNKNKFANIKILTRAHRVDLYENRLKNGYFPFRGLMRDRLRSLVFISKHGMNYFADLYSKGEIQPNYQLYRLGVVGGYDNPRERKKEFVLLSCSMMVPVKRIDLIAKSLSLLQTDRIHWIHIGTGCLYETIKEETRALLDANGNVTYEFKGELKNEDVIDFYCNNHVDCFISTSESEGLPVSIMEALAFGIPVIATDVGGVGEEICGNGILMSENASIFEIAQSIHSIYELNDAELEKMRSSSKEIWKERFDVTHNCDSFISFLRNIVNEY